MDAPTRVLLVEDLPSDARLAEHELGTALGACDVRCVQTEDAFLAALASHRPHLVVSDYHMPGFDGVTALRLAACHAPETPVIILTGAINEDTAVECMKAGASDYVIKEHIKRLGQAAVRALEERRTREAREAELTAWRNRYELVATASKMLFYDLDTVTGEVQTSGAIQRVLGLEVDELRTRASWRARIHPGDLTRYEAEAARAEREEGPLDVVYRVCHKHGHDVTLHHRGYPTRAEDSGHLHYVGVLEDVTAAKQSEDSHRLLAHALASITEIATITDLEDRLTYVNEAFLKVYGYSRDEVLGRHIGLIWSSNNEVELQRDVLAGSHRTTWKGELLNLRKDGSEFPISLRTSQVRDENGAIIGLLGISEDISGRKLLERRLLEAQKLEAVGRLAGGIAHDYNNMMGVVLGYAELVLDGLRPDDPLSGHVRAILAAAEKSANLTRQLLAFARRQVVTPVVVNINEILDGLRAMLARLVGEDIEIVVRPSGDLWNTRIDPTQVDQILANLVANARDAIENVGRITIATGNRVVPGREEEAADVLPGEYVELQVSDTGRGMSQETLASIFEPFFTTKAVGRGTGLGLSTVFGIVKQNNGFISVTSEVGQGSVFRILLPRFDGAAARPPERRAAEPAGGSETILVVEDEAQLLDLATIALRRCGYTVLAARSCADAIVQCENHAGPIHLLLTDVIMPGMNGRELRDRLEPIEPAIRVLFMSGHTADVIISRGVHEGDVEFIQKPFGPVELASRVRRVLDRP